MKLRVSVLLPTGLVVDGVIVETIRPVDAAAAGITSVGGGGYHVECTYKGPRGLRTVVTPHHRFDCCPFGWTSPSRIYGRVGRHTNKGLIKSFDPESFTYDVIDTETGEVAQWLLGDLELLPPLAGDVPTVPLAVGMKVVARRHGHSALETGTVTAANGDLTYTLKYDSDGLVEDGVLHRDVKRVESAHGRDTDDRVFEERIRVRAVVMVALIGQHLASIIQCLGNSRYRALLLSTQKVVLVSESHITAVRPVLHDALDSDAEVTRMFLSADEGLTGTVTWAAARRALKESTPTFGLPISDGRLKDIFAELALIAAGAQQSPEGRSLRAGKGKTVVEDGDMPLTFADFELALRRYRNSV